MVVVVVLLESELAAGWVVDEVVELLDSAGAGSEVDDVVVVVVVELLESLLAAGWLVDEVVVLLDSAGAASDDVVVVVVVLLESELAAG